jgi:diacylglycerol kinase (ATP)
MRIVIIGNPISGRGAAGGVVRDLDRRLRGRGHALDVRWTVATGDAERLAATYGRDADRVVVAGGDGTLREVFAGLGDSARIVPMASGTANMLARELRIPKRRDALVALIEGDRERRVDVGFDAIVTEAIARDRRGVLGYRAYWAPIWRIARHYRPPRLRVWLDDAAEPLRCGFMIASNVRHYGGIMRLSRRARVDSGEFEVCLASPASTAHLLALGPFALTGTLHRAPGFETRWATRVRVESEDGGAVPVEVDGDSFGVTPIDVVLRPGVGRFAAGE